METQVQIDKILNKVLDREITDQEYVSIPKEQLRYLINYYNILNDETPKVVITYGTTLYKLSDNVYLMTDGEYHHNLLINDVKGEIWNYIKAKMSLLKREVLNILKEQLNLDISIDQFYLAPAENWYSFIYPNNNAIFQSNGVSGYEYSNFYFEGKHFDTLILKYTNNAIWIRVYSPSLMLQIIKDFLYYSYKEK